MNDKEKANFNKMRTALLQITKYQTLNQLRKEGEDRTYGIGYEETLEMSYENIKETAKVAAKGIKAIA
jgi:hypothetical protein